MNSPTLLRLIGWVVYTTFREALASRLFAAATLVTGVGVVFCLSIRVAGEPPLPCDPGEARMRLPLEEVQRIGQANAEGMDVASSQISLLFGAVRIHYRHYTEDAVIFVQLLLAGFVADTAGVLLALIWTAGFLPNFFDPARSAVLFAKPMPRWALLTGQYLGVLAFLTCRRPRSWSAPGWRWAWPPAYGRPCICSAFRSCSCTSPFSLVCPPGWRCARAARRCAWSVR
jgi:hypothetical protein